MKILMSTLSYSNYLIPVNEASEQPTTIVFVACFAFGDYHHAHDCDQVTSASENLDDFCNGRSKLD
jgi:hypothetical protein